MHLVAAMVLLAVLPKDDLKQYYLFDKGTTWEYSKSEDGEVGKLILKALRQENGKQIIESQEFKAGAEKEVKKETLIWWVEKGYLCWGEEKGDNVKKLFQLLPENPKKGATWKGMGDEDNAMFTLTATYMGEEKIKVVAGEYTAKHVEMKMEQEGMSFVINVHLVEKIGIVKFTGTMGDKKFVLSLTKFSGTK